MKKNILFTMQHLVFGGVEKMLQTTLDCIDYDKYEVTLFLWENSNEFERFINKNVRVIYLSEKASIFKLRLFRLFPKLIKTILLKEKFDIEILYRHDLAHAYVGFFRNKAKKYIFVHGDLSRQDDFKKYMLTKKGRLIKRMQTAVFNKADKIVCVSDNGKEAFDEYWDLSSKTVVLYNAVDINAVKALSGEATEYYGDYFVNVSRLSPEKNVLDTIKAFNLLLKSFPTYKLLLIGDGPERERLEIYCRENNLSEYVIFCGNQLNPYKYIAKAKLFLFTSVEECFGIVAVESTALGVPFVSYENRGVAYLKINGIITTPMQYEKLAEAAESLLNDEKLYSKTAAAAEKSAMRYNVSNFKTAFAKLLEE